MVQKQEIPLSKRERSDCSALTPQQLEELKTTGTVDRVKADGSVKRYWGYPDTYAQTLRIVENHE